MKIWNRLAGCIFSATICLSPAAAVRAEVPTPASGDGAFLKSLQSGQAWFEVGQPGRAVTLDNKTAIVDVTGRGSVRLSGMADTARIFIKKGAKLTFRGNSDFKLAAQSYLLLDSDSGLVLKPSAGVELNSPVTVPAKQIMIVDPGKVLGSAGNNAPGIYPATKPAQ